MLDRLRQRWKELLETIEEALFPPPDLVPVPVKPEASRR